MALAHMSKQLLPIYQQGTTHFVVEVAAATYKCATEETTVGQKRRRRFGCGHYQCGMPYLGPALLICLRLRR